MNFSGLTRRNFVTGAAGVAVAAAAAPSAALADEAQAMSVAPAWDAKPESVADKASSTADYDCVIVGAGNTGIFAAVELAMNGAKTLIVERSGAACMWAGDFDALDSQIQKNMGITIDKEFVIGDILRYNQGKCDQSLVRQWAYNSGAMTDRYQELMRGKGADVSVDLSHKRIWPENLYYSPCSSHSAYQPPMEVTANTMGAEVAQPIFLEYIAENGGEVVYNTTAVELVQPEGPGTRVTGVICQAEDGSYVQYNAAKAVFLCTGGFSGNKDMMDQLGMDVHKYCSNHIGGDGRNGDGIKMAVWAGAAIDREMGGSAAIFDRGCITTAEDNGGIGPDGQGGTSPSFWWPGSQPFLRVNSYGRRFCNEDGPYDTVFNLATQQPGGYWWQVFDDTCWDDIVRFDTTLCSRLVAQPGTKNCLLLGQFYPCGSDEQWREVYLNPNVENGNLIKCDTLEELAEAMGFDAEGQAAFLETVERYNRNASLGWDYDYGKAPFRLSAIDQGPYYAAKMSGWLLCTLSGVRVDCTYNALTPEGKKIPGLKVCGLDHGGFFTGIYPQFYGGLCLSHNLISGWLGAKDVLGLPYPVPCWGSDHAYYEAREGADEQNDQTEMHV